MGILQRLLVTLQIFGHAIETLTEIGELIAPGDRDTVGKVAFGELAGAAQQLGERRAQAAQ